MTRVRPSLLGLLILAAACDRSTRSASTDSLLSRDLTLAAAASPAPSLPMLGDTATSSASLPAAAPVEAPAPRAAIPTPRPRPTRAAERAPVPAPVTPAPAPTDAPATTAPQTPAPVPSGAGVGSGNESTLNAGAGRGAIGSGTGLVGRTNAEICSLANRPGDRLIATLSSDVLSTDGARLPAGTPILVEMTAPSVPGEFAFRVKAVQVDGVLIPIDGAVQVEGATTERRVSKGGDKGKVIGGAIAGAILGRVLGGGTKGTVIGAAGGAAAGTIAASRNSVTEKCLPAGATLTVTLSAPLVLTPGAP